MDIRDVKVKDERKVFRTPKVPDYDKYGAYPKGTKNLLTELGPEKFSQWLKNEKAIYYTDTTFRDAHQSLLATRMRSIDMLKVAEGFAKNNPQVFSMEVWGGATFDVCMRFLHENPWERLAKLRRAVPNILLQMLLRGSNAVGYKAYPDNLIERFIEKSAETGIDVFRIFDSLNWLEAMKVSIKTVREKTNSIAEASICYTGDILDPEQKKYTLKYYVEFAKQLENEGAHIIAIKDMAGLLKPYAAKELVAALKSEINLPIHLHTHDTSSIQSATYLQAIEAGVDVVDVALGSMSGLTSQPNFNSVASAMKGHERELKLDINSLNQYSTYWEYVREHYYPFESGLKAGTAEVYDHEIPGGQYSNLSPQANALGLGHKFEEIKKNYALVNKMFGDLVKVTPSSKVVGDMALYMTSNNLTPDDIFQKGHTLSFPDSVVNLFKGDLGQPVGGFPEQLSKIILKGEKPFTDRPNKHLEPIDFKKEMKAFQTKFDKNRDESDLLAYLLYPKVYEDYYNHQQLYGEVGYIPTLAFFYGMKNGEEILVEIAEGKTIIIRLLYISEPNEEGLRTVSFELNGQTRRVKIKDNSAKVDKITNQKVSTENEVGAPLQGKLAEIKVKVGDEVTENTALFVIEAMKMESSITPPKAGKVKAIHLKAGDMVEQDDLVVSLE